MFGYPNVLLTFLTLCSLNTLHLLICLLCLSVHPPVCLRISTVYHNMVEMTVASYSVLCTILDVFNLSTLILPFLQLYCSALLSSLLGPCVCNTEVFATTFKLSSSRDAAKQLLLGGGEQSPNYSHRR